jgi:Asp-tRNA(Asn)/Glu-tRNA(Gln) amidotransferase A subunit family amidase
VTIEAGNPPSAALQKTPAVELRTNTAAELTATDYLRLLSRGEITALDYVRACMDRIDELDPRFHAFECYDRENAERRARKLDEKIARNEALGQMTGVPVGVKDVINTYDFPTGRGSAITAGYRPGNDARMVSNIRLEGGLIAGKTVTAEFAVHHPGLTVNPFDPARIVGTSSSGSAVAVAARMVPVALATQTGGSIMRPSSYCAVFGYKPSFGLIPRTGVLKTTDTLDSMGFMARSLADLRLVFEVTRVRGHNYPVTEAGLTDPERNTVAGRPWRIGVVTGPKSHLESPFVRAGLERLARRLAEAGAEVSQYRLPEEFDQAHDIHERIYCKTLAYYFKEEWALRPDLFSGVLADMMARGRAISTETYLEDTQKQARLSELFEREMAGKYDVLVGLATAGEAPLGHDTPDVPDHNLIWTMSGVPVMTLPMLAGEHGLPAGLAVVARKYADYLLFAVAEFVESVARQKGGNP